CGGELTILAAVRPGAGGAGGDADVSGPDGAVFGAPGQSATAIGGRGGDAGTLTITARKATVAEGTIQGAPGGAGGKASATGGNGAGGPPPCGRGGAGGNADARGGKAGNA